MRYESEKLIFIHACAQLLRSIFTTHSTTTFNEGIKVEEDKVSESAYRTEECESFRRAGWLVLHNKIETFLVCTSCMRERVKDGDIQRQGRIVDTRS